MRARLVLALAALAACDAASPDPALDALLQVEGAQWRPGPLPDDAGGPAVVTALSLRPTVTSSTVGERLRGALEPEATGLIIGLDGDAGGWIVTAGLPEVDTPDLPSFSVSAGIGPIAPGPVAIDFIAVDGDGRAGPATRLDLVADDAEPPDGALVISLVWPGAADLDLHVVDPTGAEVWSGDANSWDPPPPGTPPDPDGWMEGGILSRDANAGCARDGAPREDVIWAMPPPSGEYTVRVDTRSLCGDAGAEWYAAAWRDGALLDAVRGRSGPADTRFDHGAGAGALALRFAVP